MEYSLPRDVRYIIDSLNKSGYRADVVGGAVRDMYLGRGVGDYDITTDALPEKIKEIFRDLRTIDTGIKHGTVALHINGVNYEVTTYRRDGDYLDSRHPASVEFTASLAEDVLRRDFTMNALCYNERDGITDLTGGRADIDRRIIRTVGDPVTRFSEDALRILRALRFSATLGFSIEDGTARAIHECRELLAGISRERIYTEWMKLIAGDNAYSVIDGFFDVLSVFFPMLGKCLPKREKFESAGGMARMLSLFCLGSREPASDLDSAMNSLKTDRAARELGVKALELVEEGISRERRGILHTLAKWGLNATKLAVDVGITVGKFPAEIAEQLMEAEDCGIPYTIRGLAIDGNDLIRVGIVGKNIGRELSRLLSLVIDGECENSKDALLFAISNRG